MLTIINGSYAESDEEKRGYLLLVVQKDSITYPIDIAVHEDTDPPSFFLEISHPDDEKAIIMVNMAEMPHLTKLVKNVYPLLKSISEKGQEGGLNGHRLDFE